MKKQSEQLHSSAHTQTRVCFSASEYVLTETFCFLELLGGVGRLGFGRYTSSAGIACASVHNSGSSVSSCSRFTSICPSWSGAQLLRGSL